MDDVKKIYAECAAELGRLVDAQAEHRQESPTCPVEPLCVGPDVMIGLILRLTSDPMYPTNMMLTAVGELGRAKDRERSLLKRLEVQRSLAADLGKALADAEATVAGLGDQLLAAERENGRINSELIMWEESADILGPVLPVTPEAGS